MCELRLGVNYFYNDSNDGYDEFRDAMASRFSNFASNGSHIFTTNVDGIWEMFLDNLPKEARQFYNCNACKHFFNRYGGLVTITDNGDMQSMIFDEQETPKFFLNAVKVMKRAVMKSKVVGVFASEERNLGYPVTGEHTHFFAQQPKGMVHNSRVETANQKMAKKREEFKMLMNAVNLYTMDTVDKALALIHSDTMYRSRRVLGVAEWFKGVMDNSSRVIGSDRKRNLMWKAVVEAPSGYTHVRSSMIGTLLDDIELGLPTSTIKSRFEDKMENYMRSTSTPSEMAIYEAERTVAKLGIENSLERRYANYDEIPSFLWEQDKTKASMHKALSDAKKGGVFAHLTPRETQQREIMNLPTSVMTWAKFNRTVLPTADKIEALVDNPSRMMALVTASDVTAPNILQWDNTFSWYYHGGVDGEMKRRIEEAGGRYENNEIRCSLIWEGLTDLDLHCITPRGKHIYWSEKRSACGGYLDLDMNGVDMQSRTPVENMRWASNAPNGRYRFYVNNFAEKVNGYQGTPFRVELEINGKVYHYDGKALKNKESITVFEFDYVRGQQPNITGATPSFDDSWSVEANEFVEVKGITTSPNLWGNNPNPNSGQHIFFMLDGVKDLSEGEGRGFFNEMLKSELRPIRKTLELFTKNTPIEGLDKSDACGLGYSVDNDWNLTLKVTSGSSTRLVKIDRWD